jgi:hypothetical protein
MAINITFTSKPAIDTETGGKLRGYRRYTMLANGNPVTWTEESCTARKAAFGLAHDIMYNPHYPEAVREEARGIWVNYTPVVWVL